ncbi:MAG: efflux RND transporter periplasmic adaptor subunit [Acidobacteriota bacterium]
MTPTLPKSRLLSLGAAAALGACLASCGKGAKKPGAPPAVPVTAAAVEAREVPLEASAVGRVDPFSTVAVRSRVGGPIVRVTFREGQDVRKDELLFEIDRQPFEVGLQVSLANLERDRARAREADENAKRYEQLVKKDYVTKEQASQTTSNAEALRAIVKADEGDVANARLNLSYCTITAPTAGRTGSLLVNAGNLVKANDDKPLVVINQVEPVFVTFAIPEGALADVKKRAAAGKLTVLATPNGAGATASTGELTFIDNTVDTATGTINLKATFPNRDHALWPGQFATVSLRLASETGALVIPTEAVQTGQAGTFVYVIGADETVTVRPVAVHRTYQKWSLIEKGLAAGERVVTDGQLRLAPGMKVAIKT